MHHNSYIDLVLIDLETFEITNTCLQGNNYYVNQAVWSPDSRQIVFFSETAQGIVLYDRVTADAYLVFPGDRLHPKGWLISGE